MPKSRRAFRCAMASWRAFVGSMLVMGVLLLRAWAAATGLPRAVRSRPDGPAGPGPTRRRVLPRPGGSELGHPPGDALDEVPDRRARHVVQRHVVQLVPEPAQRRLIG